MNRFEDMTYQELIIFYIALTIVIILYIALIRSNYILNGRYKHSQKKTRKDFDSDYEFDKYNIINYTKEVFRKDKTKNFVELPEYHYNIYKTYVGDTFLGRMVIPDRQEQRDKKLKELGI